MKKFIALTVVSYEKSKVAQWQKSNDGNDYDKKHNILMDVGFIKGATDFLVQGSISNFEGTRIILTVEGQEFFNKNFFPLDEYNGLIKDNCVLVTEKFDEIKNSLCEG